MDRVHSICHLEGHEGRVWRLAWHPQGKLLASCGEDRSIRLWVHEDGARWIKAAVQKGAHARAVRCVSWSPCGRYLASAGFDGVVIIWSVQTKKDGGLELENLASLEGHENEAKAVAWSMNGQLLATCGRDKSVWIWEIDDDLDCQCLSVLQPHTQDVKSVLWHPDGKKLFSCSYDNTVRVHEEAFDDWSTAETIDGHQSTVWNLAFDASGQRMVTASADLSLRLWFRDTKLGKWRQIANLTGCHDQAIYDCHWCPITNLIASVGGDNRLCLYRVLPPNELANRPDGGIELWTRRTDCHEDDVNCVAWNPNQDYKGIFATCSDDELIRLWQVNELSLSEIEEVD